MTNDQPSRPNADENLIEPQKEEKPNQLQWYDTFFLGSSVASLVIGIIACFVPQLSATRPLFFGMLVSLLTHKLLGGIGEGEVTNLRTAMGNIKITGPIVVLAFSTGALWLMFSKADAISRIKSIPGEKEIVVFTIQKGQSTDVSIHHDSNFPMFIIKNGKTSLFDYFVEKCYLYFKCS